MIFRGCLVVAFTLLLPMLGAVYASADVVVLHDGSRLETEGPWKVDGRQVQFVDRQGRYSALRLDDVDLEASREATERRGEPRADPPAKGAAERRRPRAEPVLTLTNRDVGSAGPEALAQIETGPKVILYVTSWCGVCHKTRDFLDQLEVEYIERDIEQDPVARMERDRKFPNCGIPVVDIDGEYLCGFRPKRMRELLKALEEPEKTSAPDSTGPS